MRHGGHFVSQNGGLPSSFSKITYQRRRARFARAPGATAPPRACAGPPPRGGLRPRPPPRSTSLTTCLQQANRSLRRQLPGAELHPNISNCTSEWLSFPRPSAAREPRRGSRASRGRVPEVSLHTAVKGQFGLGTGRAMGKALKECTFLVFLAERKGHCYCQTCILHRKYHL